MSGGGGGSPNVQTYDPSEKDAELQMMKTDLTDQVTKRAFGLQQNANVYRDQALTSLNDGLGLLSNFLNQQTANAKQNRELSTDAVNESMSLHDKAKAGANFLTASTLEYMKQAEQMDRGGMK